MAIELLIAINVLFFIFLFVVAYVSLRYFINQIEKYPRVTHKEVFESKKLKQKYNIGNKKSPKDYGFDYEEVVYKSGKLNLYGWFIKNENAKKTIIILHGRGVNKLSSIQYLQLFKDLKIEKEYNFFIPDLRNSGMSDVARTKMGYNFAQDIFHTMEMLCEKYSQKNFILYGFSQGAMGSAIVSKYYQAQLRKKGISIEKMILDSSISNVKKRIKSDAKKRKVPKFIVSIVIRIFNLRVGSHLENLRLGYLLKRIPTLIIQSKNDKATTYSMLMEEYEDIKKFEKIKLKVFEKGAHTRIYAENECKDEYTKVVGEFLKS